jgi:predicted nucleotidyltransferase
MKIKEPNQETAQRIKIAKEYFDLVKDKMGEWFISAYVFGSTCRNEAKKESDIDVVFVFKKPTQEQRRFFNSLEGGLWDEERQGIINGAFNEHYAHVYAYQFEKEYKISISPYYHYEENGVDHDIWVSDYVRIPFYKLIKNALKYPDDLL